jgi:tetratricopeptide (TPR) repeat protein
VTRRLRTLSLADPKSVQFHTDVGNVRTKIGDALLERGKAQAALAELEGSLSEFGGSPDVDALPTIALNQFRIGKAYEMLKDQRQAQIWYQKSIPALEAAKKRGFLEGPDAAALDQARRAVNH